MRLKPPFRWVSTRHFKRIMVEGWYVPNAYFWDILKTFDLSINRKDYNSVHLKIFKVFTVHCFQSTNHVTTPVVEAVFLFSYNARTLHLREFQSVSTLARSTTSSAPKILVFIKIPKTFGPRPFQRKVLFLMSRVLCAAAWQGSLRRESTTIFIAERDIFGIFKYTPWLLKVF